MKTVRQYGKQKGFFDLGLSLGLMLVFGGTAAVIDSKESGQNHLAKPDTEVQQSKVVVVKSEE